jgi:uncharacterized membrane protein
VLVTERTRVAVCAMVGAAVAAIVATSSVWELAVLAGWVAATAVLLAWLWLTIAGCDGPGTAAVAMREDDSRTVARVLLLSASAFSLLAVAAALHQAANASGATKAVLTMAAMLTIASSWLTVQTVFTLRYAHLFYTPPVGGIDFPRTPEPSYRDFAYLSFSVGMTFQVSDTAVERTAIRSSVLRHALLSYVFAVAIIAATINVLASFVG